ncbi:LPS export ABC transporter ATP-binding protein [Alphaproteobacteria bacterium]|nr:LPS export ABC transporter ATP-binding protein [Alphaproteobacteria bacterium]MDC0148041.1 LPS export ABC transporter ATP-binding protein [Alphaproteobacteria bacterium]MDC1241120.1 LPS export ABC transporter ATP-binding protein [bacterium]
MSPQQSNSPAPKPEGQHDALHKGGLGAYQLTKSFGNRVVVKNVSLQFDRREAIGLLGPNGAGKTTTFYMITGLIRPDSGQVLIDGHDVSLLPMYRRARMGIGYLPQEASIFRTLSVEQNIMAILEATEPDPDIRTERLEELLDDFSIGHVRHSLGQALSGGERRRAEIARSLASNPSFILLDEPFAGIDPIAINDIRDLVAKLKQRGLGVLITDHNVRETLGIIDRAVIIHDGQVLMEGTADEIVANPEVRASYLGSDFSL